MEGLSPPVPAFSAGGVKVYNFNGGDFPIDLAEVYGADAKKYFAGSLKAWFPSNSMFVAAGSARIVVDPGDSARLAAPMVPPPDPARFRTKHIVTHLAEIGVRPKDVTHVVVTHLHTDHFLGTTMTEGQGWQPTFPVARHIIPRRDWEMPDIADARKKGDRDVVDTLGVIEKAGLVDLVEGALKITPEVSVEPYPGESPGHQVLHASAGGRHCYCIGDLYHLKEEVDNQELVAAWTDRPSLLGSKAKFARLASKENALILSGHMAPGRISISNGALRWADA